jgi:abortive infection bacteriophage resistance protein
LRYGPFAHEEAGHFHRTDTWRYSLDELHKEYARSRETFAEHYRRQYPQLSSPPLWVACELMSLGHLSRWLQNLLAPKDRQAIANTYGLDEKVLVSFVHHLTVVRNHCAHHGRVWNRKLSLKMLIPGKKPAGLAVNFNPNQDRRVYNTLTLLAHLMRLLHTETAWPRRVRSLVLGNPHIDPGHMGFPSDWHHRPVWREMAA